MMLLYLHLHVSPHRHSCNKLQIPKARNIQGLTTGFVCYDTSFCSSSGIFYLQLKRQRFQLLFYSFRELQCLVQSPHKGKRIVPRSEQLKSTCHFIFIQQIFTECLLYAKPCAKCFTYVSLFNLYANPARWILSSPFFK